MVPWICLPIFVLDISTICTFQAISTIYSSWSVISSTTSMKPWFPKPSSELVFYPILPIPFPILYHRLPNTCLISDSAWYSCEKWKLSPKKFLSPTMGWMVAPQNICPHLYPRNMTIFAKRVFAYIIKNLEMRSFWIIRMTISLWEKEEKAMWREKQRLELCIHKSRNVWNHQKLEKARKDSLLESLEGVWQTALLTFWFQTSDLYNWRNLQNCCFIPSTLS